MPIGEDEGFLAEMSAPVEIVATWKVAVGKQ
jgi:hypothetical protein